MDSAFQYDHFLLKRQMFALTGKFRLYNPQGQLVLFSQQKMFKLKEDIRVYSDEAKTRELLLIQARQIMDFSAAYDVIDSQTGIKIGVLRRKGFKSIIQDEWQILDPNDQPVGVLHEDTLARSLLRRFLLGKLLPQDYDLLLAESRVADLRQRFNLFRYELDIDCTLDTAHRLDRRLAVAAGILLATVEGRQE